MNATDKTIVEIASRWNVSPRYVQYLCKQDKIKGAIKRAGVWFIPDSTPPPVKNNKSNVQHFDFVGTKKRIFDNAITLYMERGFENVSMRDLAEATGIRQSAMYNHFSSKQHILEAIYDFYCHFLLLDRPTLEQLEPTLQYGSVEDIVKCSHYLFHSDYLYNMLSVTKILFQRAPIDSRAKEIIRSMTVQGGIEYVKAIFDRAVHIGRLAPLDSHSMAVFINGVRIFTLLSWIIDDSPEAMTQIIKEEMTLYHYASKLLVDLKKESAGAQITR